MIAVLLVAWVLCTATFVGLIVYAAHCEAPVELTEAALQAIAAAFAARTAKRPIGDRHRVG